MSLISEYVDQDDLGGGRFRNVIWQKPIAVRQNGSLLAMIQDFADGDASFPHAVERAPLRVRRANDGGGRMYPVPRDDTKYIALGPPKIQIAGVWTQVSLGTPSRAGNTLTWTRPQTLTTFTHGGHFADLRIELLGGFVPENNLVAFPVAIQGLTRSGLNINDNGRTVARLRPFQMIDAANPLAAPRAITQAFVNIGGVPHLRLTLPSLAGMTRPVIDPTLELQPDGTAGKDATMIEGAPDGNNGTSGTLSHGDFGGGSYRHVIEFDLSSIPASATVSAASLIVKCLDAALANDTVRWYRVLRAWLEAQVTWNKAVTSTNWGTAGCDNTTTDRESASIGGISRSTGDSNGTEKTATLDTTLVQGWISGALTNRGMLGKADTESGSTAGNLKSSDDATAEQRPKFIAEYAEAVAGQSFVRAPFWGRW